MNEREARMRCIEAIAAMGVREPQRLMKDAKEITEWVMAGDDGDKPRAPLTAGKSAVAGK